MQSKGKRKTRKPRGCQPAAEKYNVQLLVENMFDYKHIQAMDAPAIPMSQGADLMEVIYAAAIARGYTIEQLENVRAEKAEKRGSFQKKILLVEVTED